MLQGGGGKLLGLGRRLGVRLKRFEDRLGQPRFLVVFILATLLAVFY